MYVPVSSFNFIGNFAVSIAEWQLILNRGWTFPVSRFSAVRQELITPFSRLGIEFDELSANEKLQHILDVTR
jgi:hypothetical protein